MENGSIIQPVLAYCCQSFQILQSKHFQRGCLCGYDLDSTATNLNYSSRMIALRIIGAIVSKPYQKFISGEVLEVGHFTWWGI